MKQFDYKEYLKNNPLLKEDIEEASKKLKMNANKKPQLKRTDLAVIDKMNDLAAMYGLQQRKLGKGESAIARWSDSPESANERNYVELIKNAVSGRLSAMFVNAKVYDYVGDKDIINPKTWDKYFKKGKKFSASNNSTSIKDELEEELEELDMEIYRIEEELAELEEEGEDTSGLVDDLNKLEKYRDKLIAKLEKLK
jgi:hypothetical protein